MGHVLLPFRLHSVFTVHASGGGPVDGPGWGGGGRVLFWLPLEAGLLKRLNLPVAWERAGHSGLELHDVGNVY